MQNTGTLVTAAIRPNDDQDKIASAYAVEIKGGLHHYETLAERDAIIKERRSWGMLCVVYDDPMPSKNGTYQLKYGAFDQVITENKNWVKFNLSGGGGGGSAYWVDPVISVIEAEPGSPSDGERYILGPTPSGVNWGAFVKDTIVQYNGTTAVWEQITPLDSMSVRVLDQGNTILRYNDGFSVWSKENLNQVIRITATSSNAIAYTADNDKFFDYGVDSLYVVRFATANAGPHVTLDVNGVGSRTVWQQTNYGTASFSGDDININVDYTLQYDGTDFRLTKPNTDATLVKYRILPDETVVVPAYQEYLVYGDLEVNGKLTVDPLGKVVVINGGLNVNGGTVSNYANVSLISLATTTNALQVRKFSTIQALNTGIGYNIVHNLDSFDVSVTVWDESTYAYVQVDVVRDTNNDITVTNYGPNVAVARIVIMG